MTTKSRTTPKVSSQSSIHFLFRQHTIALQWGADWHSKPHDFIFHQHENLHTSSTILHTATPSCFLPRKSTPLNNKITPRSLHKTPQSLNTCPKSKPSFFFINLPTAKPNMSKNQSHDHPFTVALFLPHRFREARLHPKPWQIGMCEDHDPPNPHVKSWQVLVTKLNLVLPPVSPCPLKTQG
jgi:hypothetical protein